MMKTVFSMTLCAVLGCGLMAGLFFAFSVCVMKALAQLPAARGIAAMQSINVVILNPIFFAAFFGTTAACFFLLVFSHAQRPAPGARCLLIGSAFYLIGVLLVTIAFNVPMNDALAAVKPTSAQGARLWAGYLSNWTAWNHVRAVCALAATACFALALHQSARA